MVDNIKIHIEKALPNPSNNDRLIHVGTTYNGKYDTEHYILLNRERNSILKIQDHQGRFAIFGSIRKWHFGKASYKDLSPMDIVQVVYELASVLGVTVMDIALARISRIEIGKTFTLNGTECATFIEKVFSFSRFEDNRYKTSVTFEGQDFHIKLYDKVREIISKNPKAKTWMQEKNKLRIELRLKDQKGVDEKLRGIQTLQGLLLNYRMVIVNLLKEIKRLHIKSEEKQFDAISFKNRSIKEVKRFLVYKGIHNIGTKQAFHFLDEMDCSIQGKSKYRKEFRTILTELEHLSKYGRKELLRDVKEELAIEISNPALNLELL